MKARCNNPNHVSYKNYGGRGISVCDEWNNDYKAFYNDMIEDFFEGAELDRIDNDKNYSKENCRWVKEKLTSIIEERMKKSEIIKIKVVFREYIIEIK